MVTLLPNLKMGLIYFKIPVSLAEEGLKLAIGDYKSSFVDVVIFTSNCDECSTFVNDVLHDIQVKIVL